MKKKYTKISAVIFLTLFMTLIIGNKTINAYAAEEGKICYPAEGVYTICSVMDTNKAIDIRNANISSYEKINLYDVNSSTAQIFYFQYEGNGYYSIRANANRDLVLDVCGGKGYNGAEIILYPYHGGDGQLWRFYTTDGDTKQCYIVSKLKYVLDAANGSTDNGTTIQIYKLNRTNAQRWKIRPNYNSSKAVEYALKYTDDSGSYNGTYNNIYNIYKKPNPYSYIGNDCTNYVSQCLYAGGLKETYNWTRVLRGQAIKDTTGGVAWTQAKSLFNYLINDNHYNYEKVKKLDVINVGDVVFLDTTGDGTVNHATICTEKSNGKVYYCAHSRWRKNYAYDLNEYYSAYVIHIP